MAFVIESVKAITASTTATVEDVDGKTFLIQNNTEANTVYIKEKSKDDTDVTSANGFAIHGGETLEKALRADKLSIVASAANTEVKILYGREEL